jgi:hypothetical protein
MDEKPILTRSFLDFLFGVVRTGYITAVMSAALMFLCALMAYTPGKAFPGSRFYWEVAPMLCELFFCLFLFGAFWVEFSERAYKSPWIRGCVYLAFVIPAFGICV